METSVQEALKIGLVNNQIHTLVISGGTGVGKSFMVCQCLKSWQIPYRVVPVYIDIQSCKNPSILKPPLNRGR